MSSRVASMSFMILSIAPADIRLSRGDQGVAPVGTA
jgi:hypothetical protein